MRKNYWLLGLLLTICYSCSDIEDFSSNPSSKSLLSSTTRAAGDEKYDVLGYGYDVTGEYLHPLSVRNPVLNITKYDQEKHERVQYGTSSFGHDQMYYGYSASDYTKDIINETNVDSNMSYGNEKVDTVPYFSGNITNNNYLKTEYAYSDKYSFASVDAVRNRKYIKINDEVSSLSQYLSDSFKEDLERLSPDRLVERYGTHVLTDFIIGGRYKLMYRSVITHTKDATHKKTTVASGLKAALFGIGFSLNISRTVQTDESLVKDNQNKELFVQFYGGNGTSLKYDLEKGMPTGVDVQSWENSVSLSNACLTNINWKETYPIYDFISDPVKKEEIKQAVEKYIKASKLHIIELLPLYLYCHLDGNHYTTTIDDIADNFPGYLYYGIEGYVLKNPAPGTVPLYQYYNHEYFDHYTTDINDISGGSWTPLGITGYVYQKSSIETIPLYDYFYQYNKKNFDHYTTTDPHIAQKYPGWAMQHISGYIYPTD